MLERLKSRKFWITVLAVAGLSLQGMFDEAVQVVMLYIAAQGVVDGLAAFKKLPNVTNIGHSADRSVDPSKVRLPAGGDAVQKAKA